MDVDEPMHEEIEGDEDEEMEELPELPSDERIYSLDVLKIVKEAQQLRGLRHGDYVRYRQYCAKKLHRLRKSLRFPQGTRTKYQGKVMKPEIVNSAKFLEIPLFITERAWSHGMQLKQEMGGGNPRKKFHMLRKFNRAALWAGQLVKICDQVKCDARTRLEAEAYYNWMQGVWFFHQELWQRALECFTHCQTIYETISSSVDEETRLLYKQRLDETTPQIRFCAYNIGDTSAVEDLIKMRLQGGSGMGQDVMAKLDDLIAQNKGKQSGTEVTWLGKTIPVKNQKVRVLLISGQEVMKQLDTVETADGKLEVLENLLNMLREALQLVQEEVKTANVKDATPGSVSSTQLLHSYLTYLKNQRNNDRSLLTIRIMSGQAKLSPEKDAEERRKKHKPQDFIRLYDTIVDNNTEITALPGVSGSNLLEAINAQSLLYKAYRAYHIATAFIAAKKYPEGMAFFERCHDYGEQARKSLAKFENSTEIKAELEELNGLVVAQRDSALGLSVLAGEDFADVEVDILGRYRRTGGGELDLPVAKPFTFDLVLDSIKLPSLADRLAVKKAVGGKGAKPAGVTTTTGKTAEGETVPAAGGGLGSKMKGWLFGGGKK